MVSGCYSKEIQHEVSHDNAEMSSCHSTSLHGQAAEAGSQVNTPCEESPMKSISDADIVEEETGVHNTESYEGKFPPLMQACQHHRLEEVIELVSQKGHVELYQDDDGWNALTSACWFSDNQQNVSIVKYLLDNGADPNLPTNEPRRRKQSYCSTSLEQRCRYPSPKVCRWSNCTRLLHSIR